MDGLRATPLYAALAIGCVLGVTLPEEGNLLSDVDWGNFVDLKSGALPGAGDAEVGALRSKLQDKMKVVSDLHLEAKDLRAERSVERSKKAQQAIDYMEKYSGQKETLKRKMSNLRAQMANDQLLISRTNTGDETENELRKKHDGRIKITMKHALNAMRKVDHLVRGHQRTDPTVRQAQKDVTKARGSEIFTVLGLDHNQLNKDYLLTMDAAVAAYNAMPDAHSEEKMEKALEVTKERVRKEKIIEMKKKKEVSAKKTRSAQNSGYYKKKWVEKTRELQKKKMSRDKYVVKIKSEYKFKSWLQEQRHNEAHHKKSNYDKEVSQKTKVEKDHKIFRAKVAAANTKIKETREKKFDSEQKTLQDKLMGATNDFNKKKEEATIATAARKSTRVKMSTVRLNSESAVEKKDEMNTKAGHASELKTKSASEVNNKAAIDAADRAQAAKEVASEAEHKLKEILAVMDERDAKMSKAKLAKQEALKLKEKLETETGEHMAKRDEMVKEDPPPPLVDLAAEGKQIDPAVMMKKQLEEMNRGVPGTSGGPYKPASLPGGAVGAGASLPKPVGQMNPMPTINPNTGNPVEGSNP